MSKLVYIYVAVALLVGSLVLFFSNISNLLPARNLEVTENQPTVEQFIQETNGPVYTESLFTSENYLVKTADNRDIGFAELKLHNAFEDCWTSFDGVVYDISKLYLFDISLKSIFLKLCGETLLDDITISLSENQESFSIFGNKNFSDILGNLNPNI